MARRLAALGLGGLLVVGAVVWRMPLVDTVTGWTTTLRGIGAAEPATEVDRRSLTGESASVLIALGDQSSGVAFVVLVSDPSGPPAALVVPQDLLVDVPGFGEFSVVDAHAFGGSELVELAITNEFGLRIDAVADLPSSAIASGMLGPVSLDLSVPFFVESTDGGVERVLPAGASEVSPTLLEEMLVVSGVGDRFDWIQRQGSAWKTVFEEVAQAPVVADRVASGASRGADAAADLLVTVAAAEDRILATVPITAVQSVTGADAFTASGAVDFIRERFAHLLLRPEGRPRIEVLNGNGRVGTTREISAILVRDGFRVVRTDNADDFDYEETLLVAQGSHAEGWTREIQDLLGRGLLFLEVRAPSGVVDVSIIVGQDIPAGEG